jgi:3-dehydroquinate dehydratase / shikimate dehydrogenase
MTSNPTRICAVVCEQHIRDLPESMARAAAEADIVELRLDCFVDTSTERLKELFVDVLKNLEKPLIVTFRSASEGGRRKIERAERREFWRSTVGTLMSFKEVFVDIESELLKELMTEDDFCAAVDWQRVICSYHDFAGMPADLNGIYDQMAATPAGIIKIATQAGDTIDCIPMFELLARARREGREMIPIAMGTAGLATRVLGPSRGAFMTYGFVDADHATAPGQVSAKDLIELYRIHQINSQTQICALIGNPVSHSISPHIHNAAFSFKGIEAVYMPLHVRDAGEFFRRLVQPQSREIELNFRGLSVTAPHKSSVLEYLDWIEPAAQEIGAVNTIVIEDGSLRGYNTDADAFLAPLQRAFGSLENISCAIIGAGGAARTAVWSLQRAGAHVTIFARDTDVAKSLADKFGVDCKPLQSASFGSYEVVVNATPLGTSGELQNETVASAEQLRGVRLVYDLVYNPTETRLQKEAARAGCQCIGGLEMLLAQAAVQFKLWADQDAPVDIMRDAAMRALGLSEPPAVAGGPDL